MSLREFDQEALKRFKQNLLMIRRNDITDYICTAHLEFEIHSFIKQEDRTN